MKPRPAISSTSAPGWRQILPLLAIVLSSVLLIAHGTGSAETQFRTARGASPAEVELWEVKSQIRRYGCNRPQYADSVEGCRRLHAEAEALSDTVRPTLVRSPAPRRSFFGRLFGAPGRPVSRRRDFYRDGNSSWFDFGRSDDAYRERPVRSGRYRTLCVRLCDGYYYPMSFATTRRGFTADAERCEQSCESPARLFVYANPGGSPENMYDLEGNPYTSLENAFLYRSEFLPSCRCKPEPWTEEAKAAYEERAYAEAARKEVEEAEAQAAARVVQANPAPMARPVARSPSRHRREPRQRRRRRGLFGFWR